MSDAVPLELTLFGRQFRVSCPPGEEKQLLASADMVDKKMREIQDSGKVVGTERVALLAALNLAHEMLGRKSKVELAPLKAKIDAMQAAIDKVMTEQDKLF